VKRYAQQGIPREFRGEESVFIGFIGPNIQCADANSSQAWLHYSGAKSKMEANPELYPALVQTAMQMGENNEHAEIIQRGNYLMM